MNYYLLSISDANQQLVHHIIPAKDYATADAVADALHFAVMGTGYMLEVLYEEPDNVK